MTLTESRATIIFTKTWTHLNASTVRFLKRNSPHLCARPSIRSMYKPFDTISKDRSVRRQCGPTSESRTENLLRLVLRRYVCRSLDSTRDSVRAEIKQRNQQVVTVDVSVWSRFRLGSDARVSHAASKTTRTRRTLHPAPQTDTVSSRRGPAFTRPDKPPFSTTRVVGKSDLIDTERRRRRYGDHIPIAGTRNLQISVGIQTGMKTVAETLRSESSAVFRVYGPGL